MKKILYTIFLSLFLSSSIFSQTKIEWASKVQKFSSQYSKDRSSAHEILGVPNVDSLGRKSIYAWAVAPNALNKEAVETAFVDVSFKDTFETRQIAVFESFNPGSISKISIRTKTGWETVFIDTSVIARSGYPNIRYKNENADIIYLDSINTAKEINALKDTLGRIKRKFSLIKADPRFQSKKSYNIRRIQIKKPTLVYEVRIIINPLAVDGWNQIDAVGISADTIPIQRPEVMTVDQYIINERKSVNLGEKVNSPYNDIAPVVSPDGKMLYFSRTNDPENFHPFTQDIYYTDLKYSLIEDECPTKNNRPRYEDQWQYARHFTKPQNNIVPNAIMGFSPNANRMYLTNSYTTVDKNCDCDSVFINKTDGLSYCELDTIFWNQPDTSFTKSLDTAITKYCENYFLKPDSQVVLFQKKGDSLQFYIAYKIDEKEWAGPLVAGKVSNSFLVDYPDIYENELQFFIDTICLNEKKELKIGSLGWSVPKTILVDSLINDSKYINYHINQQENVMILAIENRQSLGQRDLFISFKKNPKDSIWSKPIWMGENINTLSEESSPFIDADNKTLYFASAGHCGYGDQDIYQCKRLDDTWLKWSFPQNMGSKINTPGMDANFSIADADRMAYFSSDEFPLNCGKQADVFNIQMTELVTIVFKGRVMDIDKRFSLDARVKIQGMSDADRFGAGSIGTLSDANSGKYRVEIEQLIERGAVTNYAISAQKNNYVQVDKSGRDTIEYEKTITNKKTRNITINQDLFLRMMEGNTIVDDEEKDPTKDPVNPSVDPVDPDDPGKVQVITEMKGGCDGTYCEGSLYVVMIYDSAGRRAKFVKRKPLYEKYHGYNQFDIVKEEKSFKNLADTVYHYVQKYGDVKVYVRTSASRVPTGLFRDNHALAEKRYTEAKDRLLNELRTRNITKPETRIDFRPSSVVEGPDYINGRTLNVFLPYQYTKIWVLSCENLKKEAKVIQDKVIEDEKE